MADLSPIGGHEQGGRRPVLVVSPAGYVRAISQQRLAERVLGAASQQTLDEVEWWIAALTTEPRRLL